MPRRRPAACSGFPPLPRPCLPPRSPPGWRRFRQQSREVPCPVPGRRRPHADRRLGPDGYLPAATPPAPAPACTECPQTEVPAVRRPGPRPPSPRCDHGWPNPTDTPRGRSGPICAPRGANRRRERPGSVPAEIPGPARAGTRIPGLRWLRSCRFPFVFVCHFLPVAPIETWLRKTGESTAGPTGSAPGGCEPCRRPGTPAG